ncbi:MAG: N-acetylmuramoyl-L-alanine amidase [Alphaproteobacteria bacterium]
MRTGRYRVVMTREDDRFIMLGERVAIARRMKGDIFISLHVNSNPKSDTRGISIYTLSENASDDEAAALAERENKADVLPGLNLNTTDADVASILIDLAQRQTMNKSRPLRRHRRRRPRAQGHAARSQAAPLRRLPRAQGAGHPLGADRGSASSPTRTTRRCCIRTNTRTWWSPASSGRWTITERSRSCNLLSSPFVGCSRII